ncbi:MAG: uracil phosphoribosyltransferase [Campylobacterota bacterium]|nr:uracil phosphoribosyltransferase [Campylobacterota bacterium]
MHRELHHPLIESLINTLRDDSIDAFVFRHTIKEITKLLLYEALREAPLTPKKVPTWNGVKEYGYIKEEEIVVVSVLRAALPMHEAAIDTLRSAVSGFLGIKRDEITHKSVLYYDRVGDCTGKKVILVDPMVATGGSLCDAIKVLKAKNADTIYTLNVIASPEGINTVMKVYPDVEMLIAKIDEKLNDDKFIMPGLGDAGDRAYNTL